MTSMADTAISVKQPQKQLTIIVAM